MTLYVVRRCFKSNGVYYPLGTVVTEEDDIKLFKTKVREGKLIPLESTPGPAKDRQVELFQVKFSVDLEEMKKAFALRRGSSIAEKSQAPPIAPKTPPPGTSKLQTIVKA